MNSTLLKLIGTLLRTAHRIFPGAVERFAFNRFRTPRRHGRPAREQAWLAGSQRFTIEVQPPPGADADSAHELTAWSWGSGPTVLLVHGWEGRGSQMGAFARPLVARGFRVVTFDTPAHGDTGGRRSSLPELGNAIAAAGLAVGPVHALIAHSFGCAGSAFAYSRGLRAERLVFVSPPDDFDGYLRSVVSSLGLPEAIYRHIVGSIEGRFGVRWEEVRRITLEAADENPLLVVHDRGDAETPFQGGVRVAEHWEHGRLHATDGLGHRRILRDPEVIAHVSDFIAEASAETGPSPVGSRIA